MEARAHGNRIGGRERAAPIPRRFEVVAALDGASLGSWPRSGADEVGEALAALVDARAELAVLGALELRRRAGPAAERLADDDELAEGLRARIGLERDELDGARGGLAERAAALLNDAASASDDSAERSSRGAGLSVVLPDWTELYVGTATAVLSELIAGRPVLLLADPRVPALADGLHAAVAAADLPAAALAVVHGADAEALRAAVRSPEVARVVVSGSPERVADVRQASAARGPQSPLEILADVPRGELLELGPDGPDRAAEVVERAFGRARTFSGQLPGRVEAVRCHRRSFSAFTAALLDALEASDDVRRPVPLVDERALERVLEARGLGLDEGATLILGGDPIASSRAPAVEPMVFTNVEPGMELFRNPAPGPLLRLLRAD